MAHSTNRGDRAQFSVVARLRQGNVPSLSTYGIILEIQNHLSSYKCICNVAFSPPNYIIHLPTVELQLEVLSRKTFAGRDYVLDILPWCSEYTTFNLPWIIRSAIKSNAMGQQSEITSSDRAINNNYEGPLWKGTQVKVSMMNNLDGGQPSKDFSYLMIIELKKFYYEKIEAFEKCSKTFTEMYGATQVFATKLEKAINSSYDQQKDRSMENSQIGIRDTPMFGADLANLLWFISEEIFSLQISMASMYDTDTRPIDLTKFSDEPSNGQLMQPVIIGPLLKTIAESAVHQIYERYLLIATEEALSGAFITQIWCVFFHHKYQAAIGVTKQEAEANAIYRFLKHLTNMLGYTIEDQNSDTLYKIVSQINQLTALLSDLEIYKQKIVHVLDHVDETIKTTLSLTCTSHSGNQTTEISTHANDLHTLVQHYSNAIQHASQTFQQCKETFRCINFVSDYRSISD